MKLLLIGATGRTGRLVLSEALRRGHDVTALVANPAKLADLSHPQLTVVKGNLRLPASFAATVPGHDAALLVCSSTGASSGKPLATGTANLIWQLEMADISRLLVLSRQGAGASREQMSPWWQLTTRLLFRHAFADHDQQEENIRQCGLAWTIVRPTALSDGPATGYVTAPTRQQLPSTARPRVSRADVAAFLLDQLTPGAPTRCALTLTGAAVRQPAPEPRTSGQFATA